VFFVEKRLLIKTKVPLGKPNSTLLTTKKKNGSRFGWIDRCGLDGYIHQAFTSSRHIGTIVPQNVENFKSFRL
jgi:hypothetical protein